VPIIACGIPIGHKTLLETGKPLVG
jgi:hypothetical protein